MKQPILLFLFFGWLISLQAERHVRIIHSGYLSKPDTVWIFTPSSYTGNPQEHYPVVFLMHGWSGNYHQWDDIMNCQSYADSFRFILVCPDGLYDSWYLNSPALINSRYEDFFFQDLVPDIERAFRTDPEILFITGLSMGGHGALYLFSKQPNLFKSAGSLSGVVDMRVCANSYGISKYLGLEQTDSDQELLLDYSVIGNINKLAAAGKPIIISCGTEDPFYESNNAFVQLCDSMLVEATYIAGPGGHDYPYWRANIESHFDFFRMQIE